MTAAPFKMVCERFFDEPYRETVSKLEFEMIKILTKLSATPQLCKVAGLATLLAAAVPVLRASENVPHRPFAYWADIPEPGQFIGGLVYEESEAYRIWTGGHMHTITVHASGESYGIDINQGYLALQYGLTKRWAVDLNIGATTMGTRSFNADNSITSTTGLMDWAVGVRYQIFDEAEAERAWVPTLTFRAGGVLPGTYSQGIAFAPGVRSAAIEPEFLLRKHFGWTGLGAYADALFRWNRTTGNDQYFTVIGLFQQIRGWELDVGYRHFQTISGRDITLNDDGSIDYPRDVREISDAIEAGFSYTTRKHQIRYGFHSRTVFDGNNTDRKFWVGASIDVPLGGHHQDQAN
jgi:hypothetical protein